MCRFAGLVSLSSKKIDQYSLELMRDSMISGGPDDAGIWINQDGRVGLSHRRLSIFDLSKSGHQPMQSSNGRYTLCYNGEIYNFREIKKDLQKKGVLFNSDCDTEVLLHSFALLGITCLNQFHGMFSFAIWDSHLQTLTLARDRLGVKPLYYAVQDGLFYFGSELKSIMSHPRFIKKISNIGLELFFKYSYIPHPITILEDCNKLAPGQWLTIDMLGNCKLGTWWSLNNAIKYDFDWSDLSAVENELEERLIRSFEMRMNSDVDVGVFLSGGIDSSLLLALVGKNRKKKINTFTLGYDDAEYNESYYAKRVANALSSNHHEIFLNSRIGLEIIELLPEIWDEPFGDSSAIPTYFLSKFTSKYVKVALSADGGDELFCGYPKYWLTLERINLFKKFPIFFNLINKTPTFLLEVFEHKFIGERLIKIQDLITFGKNLEKNTFIYGQHVFTDSQVKKLLKNSFGNYWLPQYDTWDHIPTNDLLTKMMVFDLNTYHTDNIHVKVDRASMSNSLEAREPFLDQDIVEFALGMPSYYKLPNRNKNQSKNILRKILYKYIDRKLIERPKMGFGVPIDKWIFNDLKYFKSSYLDKELVKKQGILNADYVEDLCRMFAKNPNYEIKKFWNLIVFQMWYKKWM
jgi:asparagine synthase (glutamine-hydrolysing)